MSPPLRSTLEELRNVRTGESLQVLHSSPELLRLAFRLAPGAAIAGAHMHPHSEQRISVVEGALHLRVEGRHIAIGRGASAAVPAGTPHYQWNPGAVEVQAIEEYRPAGRLHAMFATFFRLASEGMLTSKGGVASPLLVAAFFAEFREEVRATPRLAQWGLDGLALVARGIGLQRRVDRCLSKGGDE